MEKKTVFDHWMAQDRGYSNFGNFKTKLLQAYMCADCDNRNKLKSVFPEWFKELV